MGCRQRRESALRTGEEGAAETSQKVKGQHIPAVAQSLFWHKYTRYFGTKCKTFIIVMTTGDVDDC